ncbi:MAG TPA: type II secretion system F family protein [Acidimicrobiales bacterium]|nr:type II secretion system F family protein [Acidimicrobiales bacterium]
MSPTVLGLLALAVAGASVMVFALVSSRREVPDFGEFLPDTLTTHDEFEQRLASPLHVRFAHGFRVMVADRLEGLLPQRYMESIDRQLAKAGLTGHRRPGEQLAVQIALAVIGAVIAFVFPVQPPLLHLLLLILLPGVGFILPAARLKRKAQARSDAIFKDVPDIVDMLAISVEAGSGFEAAMSLVCQNFDSPFTDELSVALKEMELGLPRREALHQLRDRVDLDVVRTLVLALLQADALGIPIGRILKAQAMEVRARRRSWAREKAAKLPIKIMFPLVLFIFPPILALVIGPAVLSFGQLK